MLSGSVLLFSAAFFNSAWRQFRKRNAYPTAITQNVEYLLDPVQASTMLSNSEFIVMLNQAASDREKLDQPLPDEIVRLGCYPCHCDYLLDWTDRRPAGAACGVTG